MSLWAAGFERSPGATGPASPPLPAAGLGAPRMPRPRAGVIDREHAAHFPIAPYARHAGPDDGGTGPLYPAERDPAGPPPATGAPAEPLRSGALPPRPAGAWSRLQQRTDLTPDEDATVAQSAVGGPVPVPPAAPEHDDRTRAHDAVHAAAGHAPGDDAAARSPRYDDHDDVPHDDGPYDDVPHDDHDMTGGLEVVVADDPPARRSRRARHAVEHEDDAHPLVAGYDDGVDGHGGPPRSRRRPLAVVLSLLVLGGLVAGIFFGGKALIGLVNPASEDYSGQGTGSVQVRVNDGDTLSDIARSLVEADVIASVDPFVDAAESDAAAMGIQPGVYGLRSQMSGRAALDLLLDPASRLMSRVTIPEGFTVQRVLERVAEETDTPIEELTAAAADPVAVGLPPYANGLLEGWLFPATYDFEPETGPADMLRTMVARTVQVLDALGLPEDQRLTVVTKASLVQAEAALPEDMAMVARVLENRLGSGMPLQLDSTVNYATGKDGVTTTAEDRANPSPYNTYAHPGLPPGAIGNPGEDAIRAVLNPTPGEWVYFVTVDPDTGETRFAVTAEEHQANVRLFQQWLAENPGG